MAHKTVQVIVSGRVQGVFFRDCTKRKAEDLGISGWVKNCRDGTVESLISGPTAAVDEMINWFQQGSPGSRVQNVHIRATVSDTNLSSFVITY